MSFEQPKYTPAVGSFASPLLSPKAEAAVVRVFKLHDPGTDEEASIVRGSLTVSEAGTALELAHEYPDFSPVGWLMTGDGIPVYKVIARNGRTLKLEVA